MFLHDNSALLAKMVLQGNSTPPAQTAQLNVGVQDYQAFPSLQGQGAQPLSYRSENGSFDQFERGTLLTPPPSGLSTQRFDGPDARSRSNSRPSSRHQSRSTTPLFPGASDNEAFPSLGSVGKNNKKTHGKRNGPWNGQACRENGAPHSLADVVRKSPSPSPSQLRKDFKSSNRHQSKLRGRNATADTIPAPEHIQWMETGSEINAAYLKTRQEAFKHGALRNKFLQRYSAGKTQVAFNRTDEYNYSAAQAWNRNDCRAAKALSLRGQSENNLMKEAHREAARILYEGRNKDTGFSKKELFVDLHGMFHSKVSNRKYKESYHSGGKS